MWVKAVVVSVVSLWVLYGGSLQAQVLTDFMSTDELRNKVELWRKARETYSSLWYERSVAVGVVPEARELVVGGYRERKIPPEFSGLDKSVVRGVIQSDLEAVLNRSFFERVRAEHKSVPLFISGVVGGKVKEIVITVDAVRRALDQEVCRVIPCDPKKCRPDTCTSNSFKRYLE